MGIVGARRLMDASASRPPRPARRWSWRSSCRRGTRWSPSDRARQIAETIARKQPAGLVEEIQQQNQALLRALDELQRKQQELVHLNRELEDTNRGVVALYAELDEKADHLRRADELKSRFLSNMTHEFRTPVNSILGLSNLLLDDSQRLGREAEPEVALHPQGGRAAVRAGQRPARSRQGRSGQDRRPAGGIQVENLFGALRGMLRPLLLNQSVSLVFEDAAGAAAAVHRRRQGLADSAQPDFERA